ncbi:LysR family transcriptional regulator [Bacterioplanes sanyensis]|uniref:LysR family transcriptional regulator n=1 Tax=Bacterioplanes sanyensis TaxID=1249553 RepID=UPI0016735D72|nr:LysR family transcriptional regulator [Bacterioplanes sanyensis]GGY44836.1 LysR family transcriptional regulator [Bacterioplanes sanyensis]
MLAAARVFLKVVEQGSFSKAAQVLNMAPSSVARAIDGLEGELGTSLLQRSTRQLKLTASGQRFYQGALAWVAQADELKYCVQDDPERVAGPLRISVFEAFGTVQLAPKLTNFMQQFPQVQLDIAHENRLIDLLEEDVDVAIRIGRPADSGLKALSLMSNETWVAAAPSYWQRHGKPTLPEELLQHNCLLLSRGRQRSYWHFRRQGEQVRVAPQGTLSSRGGIPLLAAAEAGAGVVQLPRWLLQPAIEQAKLEPCLTDWQAGLQGGDGGRVYAVYVARTYPNPVVRAFIDFLKQTYCSQNIAPPCSS